MPTRNTLAALLAATTLLAACGGSSDTPPQAVTIDFKALVGDQAFDCAHGAGYALGTGTVPAIPKDFRFYVSNVRLVTAAGTEAPVTLEKSFWQNYGVALLDFENGAGACTAGTLETNTAIRGTVAPGSYAGLRFDLGVPVAVNHLNVQSAEPPLSVSALYWSWTGGYKHAKVELNVTRPGASAASTYNFHLGSTGCAPTVAGDFSTTVCTKLNTPAIDLASFNPATQAVAFDIAPLFAETNFDAADGGGAPGCMSGETDPECAPVFPKIGLAIGAIPAGPQAAFRVVAR